MGAYIRRIGIPPFRIMVSSLVERCPVLTALFRRVT
jgi:hypothetical protein